MLTELRRVTPQMAAVTTVRLQAGYRSRSGQVIPPARTNSKGCVLAQKVPQRSEGGYVQIPPEGLQHTVGDKALPQGAHRLAVIAYKPADQVQRLLYETGTHASHLCHEPLCMNPEHIVVEDKAHNEARKVCRGRLMVRTSISGVVYELAPAACPHEPQCLVDIEDRVAARVSV